MENNTNLYTEWSAAKADTWFTTRSPYPEVACHIAPNGLPSCSNTSSYLPFNSRDELVMEYLEREVRVLRYNNPTHSPWMIKSVVISRMAYWLGNAILTSGPKYLGAFLDVAIDSVFADREYINKIEMQYTRYWYSDEIAKMSGNGKEKSDRFKAKRDARNAVISEGLTDDLRAASLEYRRDNFNVKPTIKILRDETGYSNPTIRKYGEDMYILSGENIEQRVQRAREVYPKFTQQEIAELLKETKRTVRNYWRTKTIS